LEGYTPIRVVMLIDSIMYIRTLIIDRLEKIWSIIRQEEIIQH